MVYGKSCFFIHLADFSQYLRDYFWKTHDIDLSEYYPNNADDKFMSSRDADDDVYTIIHNKLKQII